MSDLRIISLIASATEIVCALGLEDNLVGRSHECDYPESVKKLPVCTGPKFKTDGSSYEIDQRVKEIVQESLSVYRVDASLLERLQPSHILTQSQCEVCAVSLKDVESAVCELTTSNPMVVSLQPDSLSDVWADIRKVGSAVGVPDHAERLLSEIRVKMREISDTSRRLSDRPRVACIEWIEPLMATGNWMPELIEMAGGVNLFGLPGKHSPWMEWTDLLAQDPDVIVVTPCGFDIPRTRQELELLTSREGWQGLKAVQTERVFVADGNQFFNRPGPRLLETLQILAELFHPSVFRFGHESRGWIRVTEVR
ncbi:MAG TPA: cobalamin-binding protein [Blastocatellia bacterium]|nr:cobalamin-binding protein [Blastocatellia bacterium]